jgi:hypothetical protein
LRKLGLDLVPIFEEQTARLGRGISLDDWGRMTETEKALIIAQRRIVTQMKNLQTEAEIRKAKQESKKHARN